MEQDANEMKAFNFGLLDVTLNFGKNRRHDQEYHSISFSSANCVLLYLTKKKILIDAEKNLNSHPVFLNSHPVTKKLKKKSKKIENGQTED